MDVKRSKIILTCLSTRPRIGTGEVRLANNHMLNLVSFQLNEKVISRVVVLVVVIIVILGGLGSIGGALLGGIIVGLIESFGAQFISATMTEGLIYIIFLSVHETKCILLTDLPPGTE